MSSWYRCRNWLGILLLASSQPALSGAAVDALQDQTRWLLETLRHGVVLADADGAVRHPDLNLKIETCDSYPYSDAVRPLNSALILLDDLRDGLQAGLQCISGLGPQGQLHPYHRAQARRLIDLLKSPGQKTFRCVEDSMFATAVATSPHGTDEDDELLPQLRLVDHPGVVIDTYRLGGYLSRRHDDETYRNFFNLGDAQIYEHRNAKPLRGKGLHRYQNRASLMFHELVHWLGHEHSAIRPDMAHLYETCCFGGSDYISDPARNLAHQQTACGILRDEELWSPGNTSYRQMRLWHYKGYDRLKVNMRADYDS